MPDREPADTNAGIALAGEFPATDVAAWEALAGDVDRLRSTTLDGLTIEPLYTSADAVGDPGLPGFAPFVRGRTASGTRAGGWEVRQMVDHLGERVALGELERGRLRAVPEPAHAPTSSTSTCSPASSMASTSTWRRSSSTPATAGVVGPMRSWRSGNASTSTPRSSAATSAPTRSAAGCRTGRSTSTPTWPRRGDVGGSHAVAPPRHAHVCRQRHPVRQRRRIGRPGARARGRVRGGDAAVAHRWRWLRSRGRVRAARVAVRGHGRPVRHDRQVPRRPPGVGPGRRDRGRAGRRRAVADPRPVGVGDDDPLRPGRQHAARHGRVLRGRRRRRRRDHGAAVRPLQLARRLGARPPPRPQHAVGAGDGVAPRRG